MLGIFKKTSATGLVSSQLYDSPTFYRTFERDLSLCRQEALIESPFITVRRLETLLPSLRRLTARGIKVTVNTKPLQEHEDYLYFEAQKGIAMLQNIGVEVLYTGGHHRKLAIFDRQILWEGSLNILSQNDSCEIISFNKMDKFLR
jgi:hypothetical protein